MKLSRRDFLLTSAAAAASVGFPSIVKAAAPWAQLPGGAGALPKFKILEIHLVGGASQWESLWLSHDGPQGGGGDGWIGTGGPAQNAINWRGAQQYAADLSWSCNGAPEHPLSTREFAADGAGTPISWGPATAPLWRPDIFNRCRMLVTQHSEQLHFSGSFRTVTGRRFGNPRGAAMGAAIQRHYQSLAQQQEIPYAYVLGPQHEIKPYFHIFPTAIGNHSGPARPLGLKVGSGLQDALLRPGITNSADAIFKRLTGQYQDMLRWQGAGSPLRAADFESFDSAGYYLTHAEHLHPYLGDDQLHAAPAQPCVSDPDHSFGSSSNPTHRSLELAALLFSGGARHVSVLDGGFYEGLLRNSTTPYDVHSNNDTENAVEITSAHLFSMMQGLANVIKGPGSPNGAPLIDLDDTLIYISTEFNRTPGLVAGVNGDGYAYSGRNHFPSTTVALLIGGPVASRAIHGAIGLTSSNDVPSYESAVAENALTPTDVHAGVMLSAGVNPIDADNFTAGDEFSDLVKSNGDPDIVRSNLKQYVLGLS